MRNEYLMKIFYPFIGNKYYLLIWNGEPIIGIRITASTQSKILHLQRYKELA